ncbi:MAG TPA: methyltransferase [Candidatus Paceibacterota bacterium]
MDFYNTSFYDKASADYSSKRYQDRPQSYVQFFFKNRLYILLKYINKLVKNKNDLKLLEIGCADGIVINSIINTFPHAFSRCVGTDISPNMIETAQKRNEHKNALYFLKNTGESGLYDIVLAVGFLSPGIFDEEFAYIKSHLKSDGVVIVSLASRKSAYTRIKLQYKDYIKDYWSHSQYRDFLEKDFQIIDSKPYGLFIPKLWAFPTIARVIQPAVELIGSFFLSGLFHEKLYLLKRKS